MMEVLTVADIDSLIVDAVGVDVVLGTDIDMDALTALCVVRAEQKPVFRSCGCCPYDVMFADAFVSQEGRRQSVGGRRGGTSQV